MEKIDFDRMAQTIMFAGTLNPSNYGATYRKGKTVEDVKKAVTKALRYGHGKVELELGMLAVYLNSVFKRV